MAKMADLHAQLEEIQQETCELCTEYVPECDSLGECPGYWWRLPI